MAGWDSERNDGQFAVIMDLNRVVSRLRRGTVYKLTGAPEHWLTTVVTGYWGLSPQHHSAWDGLRPGDWCLFHSTAAVFVDTKATPGVIGLGQISDTSIKDTLQWYDEIRSGENKWPHLIHFQNPVWFGDTDRIQPVPMEEKMQVGDFRIELDIRRLTKEVITFREMERRGLVLAPMGSIKRVHTLGDLEALLKKRLPASPDEPSPSFHEVPGEPEPVERYSAESGLPKAKGAELDEVAAPTDESGQRPDEFLIRVREIIARAKEQD